MRTTRYTRSVRTQRHVLGIVALVGCGCGPVGPREVRGPSAGSDSPAPAVSRLVVAEHANAGGRLVFVDERGLRLREFTAAPTTPSMDITPAWSPDGAQIAFASSRGRSHPAETSLWIGSVDGAAPPRRLTDDAGIDLWPSFAPDGRALLFASTRGGAGALSLWRFDLSTGTLYPIGVSDVRAPTWSHSGMLIAFARKGPSGSEVWLCRADGTEARRLTDGGEPSFAPDDREIAFVAPAPAGTDDELWTIGIDGNGRRRLVANPIGDESGPRFSVDGRFLFASTYLRDDSGRALFSTVVFADLTEAAPRLRVLLDPLPTGRATLAIAPVALDATILRRSPTVAEALRRLLLR